MICFISREMSPKSGLWAGSTCQHLDIKFHMSSSNSTRRSGLPPRSTKSWKWKDMVSVLYTMYYVLCCTLYRTLFQTVPYSTIQCASCTILATEDQIFKKNLSISIKQCVHSSNGRILYRFILIVKSFPFFITS